MKSKEVAGAVNEKIDAREQKRKMLEVTLAHIDKQHGAGSVMVLGTAPMRVQEVVSSGSLLIDGALGGGFPKGRIAEVYGPEASGKTTIALHVIAEVQKAGGICAFIDAEHALALDYARLVGVKIEELIVSQPDYGEQALDIAESLVRSGAVDLIVIDSVAALVPKAEIEGDMGDVHMGLQARLMSQALRKLTPVVHKSKTVILFINQIRHTMNPMPFANKETTTGGNALKFYASVRVDVRKIGSVKKGDSHIGNRVSVKIVKNKMAPPFKKVEVDLIFGVGVSKEHDLLDASLAIGAIGQSGSWFSIDGQKVAQGREQMAAYLRQHPDVFQSLSAICRNKPLGDALIAAPDQGGVSADEISE